LIANRVLITDLDPNKAPSLSQSKGSHTSVISYEKESKITKSREQ